MDDFNSAITEVSAPCVIPMHTINQPLAEAMFDLCRACAVSWPSLPEEIWEAYTDRAHSKFSPVLWQRYLDNLLDAVRQANRVPRRVRIAAHKVETLKAQEKKAFS